MVERFILNEETEKNVIEITGVDYTEMLKLEDIEGIIKDLIYEYHKLQEEFEDYKENCEENHVCKPINYYEEYGINERDFH